MITAQDIREKTFEKSRIGGYDMAAVDDFLEVLADDITASQKENAVLKSKMKVLVDKIEEYRANEEALHMAVLSAQKLAVQIENDARARAAAMIEDAEKQVKARTGSIEEEVAKQEKRLAEATAASEKFFEGMRAMCNAQLKNLDAIASKTFGKAAAPAVEEAPVEDDVKIAEEIIPDLKREVAEIEEAPVRRAPSKPRRNMESTQPFSF